jgi:hypothetical protein
MITRYPWFRAERINLEQICVPHEHGSDEFFLRIYGMPPRFLKIDRRIVSDKETLRDCDLKGDAQPGSTFNLVGVPYRIIRDAWLPDWAYWCVRDDAWWTRYVGRFDRLYYMVGRAERRIFYWLDAHHVVHSEPWEGPEWLMLPGLNRIKARRDARRNVRFEAGMKKRGIALSEVNDGSPD